MAQDKILPVFEGGRAFSDEVTATKLNALVRYVEESTPVAGLGIRVKRGGGGTAIEALGDKYVAGDYSNPYVLASCHFGASVTTATGGGGTYGPWGGVTDSPSIVPTNYGNIPTGFSQASAALDTWHRERIIRTATVSESPCYGVVGPFVRAVDGYYSITPVSGTRTFVSQSGGGVYQYYQRTPIFDKRGVLVTIAPEMALGVGPGAYQYQYELGTCRYASSYSGPNGTTGPWGGSGDAITAGYVSGPWIDLWHRDRPPLTAVGNNQSLGVSGSVVRAVTSGGSTKLFSRSMSFDARGYCLSIQPEALIATVGGPLPLNIFDVTTGTTARFSAYNGTFGENNEATAGASVPTLGGTRIDAIPVPTLSVTTGDRVVYLKVDVNSAGSITGVSYAVTSGINPPTSTTGALYVKIANISPGLSNGLAFVGIVDPQNVRGSQTYELCGGDEHLYVLS